jgi:hypothetical protein
MSIPPTHARARACTHRLSRYMNAAQLQQGVDALACYNTAISIIQREGPQCSDAESAAEMRRTMATAYASIAVISSARANITSAFHL